jgi:hypothetical protein
MLGLAESLSGVIAAGGQCAQEAGSAPEQDQQESQYRRGKVAAGNLIGLLKWVPRVRHEGAHGYFLGDDTLKVYCSLRGKLDLVRRAEHRPLPPLPTPPLPTLSTPTPPIDDHIGGLLLTALAPNRPTL